MSIILLKLFFLQQLLELTSARTNTSEDVILQFYNVGSKDLCVEIPLSTPENLLTSQNFDLGKTTVFYFHGFEELPRNESVLTILDGYLFRGDHNIVIVDWSNLNQGNYFIQAVPNCKRLAVYFASALNSLIKRGMSPDNIHLVGHSLGAQLAGLIGKNLIKSYNTLISRITHLDAAGPGFWFFLPHADKYDAKFVDSIHTDAGILGTMIHIGKVNFWPNKGTRHQPGCSFTIPYIYPYYLSPQACCSHWRSWQFFAESLKHPKSFPARPCTFFHDPNPDSMELTYMGLETDTGACGDFCLRTSDKSPFGLGLKGIT